jgi:hypothetical protein
MIGYKLTTEQANLTRGKFLNECTTFNPKEDINGDWFIFEGEVNENITNSEFDWVKELPEAEYVPPTSNNPIV